MLLDSEHPVEKRQTVTAHRTHLEVSLNLVSWWVLWPGRPPPPGPRSSPSARSLRHLGFTTTHTCTLAMRMDEVSFRSYRTCHFHLYTCQPLPVHLSSSPICFFPPHLHCISFISSSLFPPVFLQLVPSLAQFVFKSNLLLDVPLCLLVPYTAVIHPLHFLPAVSCILLHLPSSSGTI